MYYLISLLGLMLQNSRRHELKEVRQDLHENLLAEVHKLLAFSLLLFLFLLLVQVFGWFCGGLAQNLVALQCIRIGACNRASQFHARQSIILVLLLTVDKVANLVEDVAEHGLALALLLAVEEDDQDLGD